MKVCLMMMFFSILLAACNLQPSQPYQATLEAEANYWQQLGNNAGTGSNAALVSDGSSNTIMASVAFDGTANSIYVRSWDGSTWTQLGPALSAVGGFSNAASPSLALDGSGNPVLAMSEDTGGVFTIYVRRWQNGSWVPVGGALNAETNDDNFNTDGIEPSLALDSLGNPVVSWSEISGINGVRLLYMWRWTGVDWQALGTFIIAGDTRNPSLALDSLDRPVVAWQDFNGSNYDIYVYGFNGSTWVQYGTGPLDINAGFAAYDPSLALDSNNNPVITWYEELGGNSLNVYVKRWNGAAWVQYGAGGPLDITPFNTAYLPSLALDNGGNPTVAWSEFGTSSLNIYVKQWTGSAWTLVGTNPLSNTANHASNPSLSLANGNLVVGWQEGASLTPGISDSLYAKRYVTNAWQQLGNALDSSVGQSAVNASTARKTTNTPVVVWDEVDSGNGSRNVYAKEWTGSAWSVLGGAIDRTLSNDAENPSLAMRSDNLPTVAWQEANNVYVKRWNGTIWTSIATQVDTTLTNDALTPSLALDTTNIPVVAYAENGDIRVKKASGTSGASTWNSPFGTTALDITATNETFRPSLALKSDNNPIVAWYEDAGTSFNIYAKEWNGAAWVALGTTIDKTSSRDAKDIVLALRTDNRPVVAWEEASNIYVKRWTGSSWVSLGTTLDKTASNEALRPSLDLRTDNNPVVTWQEWNGSSYDVFVKRWTGSSWAQITVNAVDKTLNRNAERPSLVLKSDNNPIISWDEEDGTSENVFVRQF